MHPAVIYRWQCSRRADSYGALLGCGPGTVSGTSERHHAAGELGGHFAGGPFGVRRPLRFLAYKLQLTDEQVAKLATILNELKTERAQAEVDDRRTVTAFADAVEGESFDEARAREAAGLRSRSAGALSEAIVKALARMHALLEPQQRARLAYLIRTGAVAL